MKTEEKNTKRFWRRGNVLDIAIILLVLAAAFAIGYRYYQTVTEEKNDTLDTVMVTFEVKSAQSAITKAIKAGDVVYLDSADSALGQIVVHTAATDGTPFSVSAAKVLVQDANGNYVEVTVPDDSSIVDFEGTVSCLGFVDENGTFLLDGRTPITPGQKIAVYTEQTSFTLTVVSLIPIE
ncbi:MAG: DUF4330 family protein [Ruminococcaceae bacterium]|nr:DUF4330 family protein [Oscillospiraceae bacterium]